MARYGCTSMTDAMNMDKERLRMALKGKLVVNEKEDGSFVYDDMPRAECEKFILETFDHAVYWVLNFLDYGNFLEKKVCLKKLRGFEITAGIQAEEKKRVETYGEYDYEPEEEY